MATNNQANETPNETPDGSRDALVRLDPPTSHFQLVVPEAALIAAINDQIDHQEFENQQLRVDNQQIHIENQQIQAQNQQIIAHLQQVLAENRELRAENREMQISHQRILAENREMRAENKQLWIKMYQLEKKLEVHQLTMTEMQRHIADLRYAQSSIEHEVSILADTFENYTNARLAIKSVIGRLPGGHQSVNRMQGLLSRGVRINLMEASK